MPRNLYRTTLAIPLSNPIVALLTEIEAEGPLRSQVVRNAMAEHMDNPPPPVRGYKGHRLSSRCFVVDKADLAAWRELAAERKVSLSALLRGAIYETVTRMHKELCCGSVQ